MEDEPEITNLPAKEFDADVHICACARPVLFVSATGLSMVHCNGIAIFYGPYHVKGVGIVPKT